jgi:lipid A 4'-phosphatase
LYAVAVAVGYGLAIGMARVAMGGHFLTDVLFAGVFTAIVIWLVHGVVFRWGGAGS